MATDTTSGGGTYRTGNVQFKKSQNGVRIEFTDNSHDPIELTSNQWEQVLTNLGSTGLGSGSNMGGRSAI